MKNDRLHMRWWAAEPRAGDREEERRFASEIQAAVDEIHQEQADAYREQVCNARLYWARSAGQFDLYSGLQSLTAEVNDNVIQRQVDSVTSVVARHRHRVRALTDGGSWADQLTARRLDKALLAAFRAMNVWTHHVDAFRDAALFGVGAVAYELQAGRPVARRVLAPNLLVWEKEAQSGRPPRQYHELVLMHEDEIAARWGEAALRRLREAGEDGAAGVAESARFRDIACPLRVVRISHAVALPGAGPGRAVVSCGSVVLSDEKYRRTEPPYVFYFWNRPLSGWRGRPLVRDLLGIQEALNRYHEIFDREVETHAHTRTWIEAGSRVNVEQLTNAAGELAYFTGQPPVIQQHPGPSPALPARMAELNDLAMRTSAVNELTTQAARPEGINSARGLRELTSEQSRRFAIQERDYELTFEAAAELVVTLLREARAGKAPRPAWMAENLWDSIDWSRVDLESQRFVFSLQAASILSTTPGSRLQEVTELAQFQVLRPDEARRLLQHPDLEASDKLGTAVIDFADWTIDRLMEGAVPPIDAQAGDPQLLQERVRQALAAAIAGGAEEDDSGRAAVDAMRLYLAQLDAMIAEAQQKQLEIQQLASAPPVSIGNQGQVASVDGVKTGPPLPPAGAPQ